MASGVVPVGLQERLPLTCTRLGTCCFGKAVWVNPWEVACLAQALGVPVPQVQTQFLTDGGIRLASGTRRDAHGQRACALYAPDRGCTAHAGRPLACRLYPLARLRVGGEVAYGHDGPAFPCLAGCPSVTTLPARTVAAYLAEQAVGPGETVADQYLELVQDLGEAAFVLAIDSGLAASGFPLRARWTAVAAASHAERHAQLPPPLAQALLAPPLDPADGAGFVDGHAGVVQEVAQAHVGRLSDREAIAAASTFMLAAALHLAAALNVDRAALMARWLAVAAEAGMA